MSQATCHHSSLQGNHVSASTSSLKPDLFTSGLIDGDTLTEQKLNENLETKVKQSFYSPPSFGQVYL